MRGARGLLGDRSLIGSLPCTQTGNSALLWLGFERPTPSPKHHLSQFSIKGLEISNPFDLLSEHCHLDDNLDTVVRPIQKPGGTQSPLSNPKSPAGAMLSPIFSAPVVPLCSHVVVEDADPTWNFLDRDQTKAKVLLILGKSSSFLLHPRGSKPRRFLSSALEHISKQLLFSVARKGKLYVVSQFMMADLPRHVIHCLHTGKLAFLAILVSAGIVLQILACALYNNWWPMLTALMYVVLPMPLMFFVASDTSSLFSESDSSWADATKFLTGFSAIGSIAIPSILKHADVIGWGALAMELSSFLVFLIAIVWYIQMNNENEYSMF
ncbi:hypothetical protein NE237_026295 [Protea cynaroides]|uniref:Uncharacterized protein n=1 Tax=Protea cynaroides TaxID=273540 RepID=A0A9Q0H8N5_9MAGN|nr:hypothetical protein NE237_026295 [Protea cynaroides]